MAKGKEVTPKQDDNGYLALTGDVNELSDVLTENLGGETLTVQDLERVKVPTGGGLAWEIPTLDGEPETARTIEGVVIHWKTTRAYWKQALGEDGAVQSPPDCRSDDGVVGVGDPGGDCSTCPMNQWESAARGNGKACQENRLLFLLTPDSLLPIVVQAPATSIVPVKRYFLRLANRRHRYWHVSTKLSLERVSNDAGIQYARITPSMGTALDDATKEKVNAYVTAIKPQLDAVQVAYYDAEDEPWGEV